MATATPLHLYNSDPQSGAGNCTCGGAEAHTVHYHAFRRAYLRPSVCVCGFPPASACHW